jgi:hypothetical protein
MGGVLVWQAPGRDDGARCHRPIPRGSTIPAAWDTTALFVTEVVLRRNPACGYDLSTKRLRGAFRVGSGHAAPAP